MKQLNRHIIVIIDTHGEAMSHLLYETDQSEHRITMTKFCNNHEICIYYYYYYYYYYLESAVKGRERV